MNQAYNSEVNFSKGFPFEPKCFSTCSQLNSGETIDQEQIKRIANVQKS